MVSNSIKKSQVIFNINHYGALSEALWLRQSFGDDVEVSLMFPSYLSNLYMVKRCGEFHLFDKIIIFDDRKMWTYEGENISEFILSFYDKILEENNISLDDATVYTAGDMTNSFAVYCCLKNHKFNLFEISAGSLLHFNIYEGGFNDGWIKEEFYRIQKEFNVLTAEPSEYAHLLLYKGTDITKVTNPDYEIVDFDDFRVYDAGTCETIKECFGLNEIIEKFKGIQNAQLCLLPSRNFCNGHSNFEIKFSQFIYQLMIEYFSDRNKGIIIKPHPADTPDDIWALSNYVNLNPAIPIEFVKFFDGIEITSILTIVSNSYTKIQNKNTKICDLGWIFLKICGFVQRMDFSYKLITEVFGDRCTVFQSILQSDFRNLEYEFTEKFLEHNYPGVSLRKSVSDEPLDVLSDLRVGESLRIYFDIKKLVAVQNLDLKNIVQFEIKFEPEGEYSVFNEYKQYIYVYAEDSKILNEISNFTYSESKVFLSQKVGSSIIKDFPVPAPIIEVVRNFNGTIGFWGDDEKLESIVKGCSHRTVHLCWNKDLVKNPDQKYMPWIIGKQDTLIIMAVNQPLDSKALEFFNKHNFMLGKNLFELSNKEAKEASNKTDMPVSQYPKRRNYPSDADVFAKKTVDISSFLGNQYINGERFSKDPYRACYWFDLAASNGDMHSAIMSFEIRWSSGNPEIYEEMVFQISKYANEGYGEAIGRLGKAYVYGRGVPRDINRGTELLQDAISKGVSWASNDLFDALWTKGTEESYGEMIEVAVKAARQGNPGAMIRLGRAYRDGKGVSKNLEESAKYYRDARKLSPDVANDEFINVLLGIGTEDSYKEIIGILNKKIKDLKKNQN